MIWKKIFACFFFGCCMFGAFGQMSGVIAGKLPQLSYSSGTDRLGSAKAGYIDTGIQVLVVDSISDNYKLQLSKNRTAYLAKEFFNPIADTTLTTPVFMEAWSVKGGEKLDTVSIGLTKKVPYTSWMETSPCTIMVELYGLQANTNWITQLQSAKGVKQVSWQQTEDDVVLVRIELHQQQHLGYTVKYVGRKLVLSIKRLPERKSIKNWTIAIDAGHGGSNTGAKGLSTGILEKNYTILFAKELEHLLVRRGAKVIMTRDSDTAIDNKDRLLMLQAQQPDMLISFHLNSSSRTSVRGVSTYYKHVAFRSLTQMILDELLEIDNLPEFGNIGSFNFQLVQPTNYPSCLVEVAFLSNEIDEQMILQRRFQERVARKVYDGIVDWLKQLE